MLALTLLVLSFISFGCCAVYEDVTQLPSLEYDFVIVGGGTAGNVVANRLTENPNFSVLVLEAGVSNEGVLDSTIPFFVRNLVPGPNQYEWNYTTTPQSGLNDRVIRFPRAHILGGCSAHNGLVYTRGAADDFDRYSTLTGDKGWSWDRIRFLTTFQNEKWTAPADLHNTRDQFDPSVHSTHGLTSVSLNGFAWPIFEQHVLQATRELPDEFPFNLDMNSGRPLGIGWLQSTVGGGERSTSATSYLAAKFIRRKNLHVLLHAQVSRLIDASTVKGKVSFDGVEFFQGKTSFVVQARKEIILAAGSIGTPTILLHSGVGDKNDLHAAGIHALVDLPSVGRNGSEHPLFSIGWSVNSTQTVGSIRENATRFNEAYAQWNNSRTGPFVELGATHLAWLRLNPDSPIFENHPDPSAGPGAPHIEMILGTGGAMSIGFGLSVVSPASRGSVRINSSNPLDAPLIDLGLLTSDFDLFAAREAIRLAQRFVQAPTWTRDYVIAPLQALDNATDDALDQYLRNATGSGAHFVGTAGMSARNARYGVVDPDLLVKGMRGLRIVDASVLPMIPGAHTQAATYAVAERGADLIKQSWV
ncbi:aryl-alcohol oxidase [Mycena rebaudengoi]|nr:aryl-alcohol oxidase [Mycena rebaudengoi]